MEGWRDGGMENLTTHIHARLLISKEFFGSFAEKKGTGLAVHGAEMIVSVFLRVRVYVECVR